jgi:hypothetical protein
MMLTKLKNRQFGLFILLALTLVAAIFAPAKRNDDVVEAKYAGSTKITRSAEQQSLSDSKKININLVKKREWAAAKGRDMFPPKVKPLPLQPAPVIQAPLPPPKPVAPALPFAYVGKVVEDGKLTVFVANQGRNYLLKGGEVIEGVYRVEKVEAGRITFIYLPLAIEQIMNFGG